MISYSRLTIRFLAKLMELTTVAARDRARDSGPDSDGVVALKNIAASCASLLLQWTVLSTPGGSGADHSVAKDWEDVVNDLGKTISGSRSREEEGSSCVDQSSEVGRYADVVVSFPAILSAYELLRANGEVGVKPLTAVVEEGVAAPVETLSALHDVHAIPLARESCVLRNCMLSRQEFA